MRTLRAPRALSRPITRVAVAAVAGISAAALFAACSSSSKSATSTTSTTKVTPASSSSASFQAYATCMSQHGVKMNIPANGGSFPAGGGAGRFFGGGGFFGAGGSTSTSAPGGPPTTGTGSTSSSTPRFLPPGVTASQFEAANQACASLRPKFNGTGAGGFESSPAFAQTFSSYAACMSQNGYPIPSTFQQAIQQVTAADRQTTAYENANNACKSILQAVRPGAGSTTSTTAGSST